MGCMTVYLQTYPATCDPKDQLANQQNMRNRVFYTTDVQVRGYYGCWCTRFWEENDVTIGISLKGNILRRISSGALAVINSNNVACLSSAGDGETGGLGILTNYYSLAVSVVVGGRSEGNEIILGNLKRLAAALNATMGPNGVILKACSVKALHIRLEVAEEIACNVTCIVEHFLIVNGVKTLFAVLTVKVAVSEQLAALGANVGGLSADCHTGCIVSLDLLKIVLAIVPINVAAAKRAETKNDSQNQGSDLNNTFHILPPY
jgi:hypothetical protein